MRIGRIGDEHLLIVWIITQITLMTPRGLHLEALHIEVAPLVLVQKSHCPHFVRIILLYAYYVVLVMIVDIKIGNIELRIIQHHQNLVIIVKLSQVSSLLVVIDSVHVKVKPHFTSTQCASSMTLERNA